MIEKYRGTKSTPFKKGKNKKVAVKIVDDRCIESLKVFDFSRVNWEDYFSELNQGSFFDGH